MTINNMFSGLKDAKTSERGTFVPPGKYVVQIKKGVMKETRNKGPAFILELTIIKSNYEQKRDELVKVLSATGKVLELEELEKKLPLKEGASGSWFQGLRDKDIGFSSLKGFAANAMGIVNTESQDFKDEVEEWLTSVVDDRQSLAGMRLPLEVVEIETKKGTPFSLYRWGQIMPEVTT